MLWKLGGNAPYLANYLDRDGDVDPLTMEIKFDKKGLHSAEEGITKRRKGDALTLTGRQFYMRRPFLLLLLQ